MKFEFEISDDEMESNAKNVVTRESVLAAVKQDGWALEYASAELQADPELK